MIGYIKLAAAVAVIAAVIGFYWHYTLLVAEAEQARSAKAAVEALNEVTRAAEIEQSKSSTLQTAIAWAARRWSCRSPWRMLSYCGLEAGNDGKIATAATFGFVLMIVVSCLATVPDALLTCQDEPRYSSRPNVSTADLLEFTDKVAVAGADCGAKLRAVRKIVKG